MKSRIRRSYRVDRPLDLFRLILFALVTVLMMVFLSVFGIRGCHSVSVSTTGRFRVLIDIYDFISPSIQQLFAKGKMNIFE